MDAEEKLKLYGMLLKMERRIADLETALANERRLPEFKTMIAHQRNRVCQPTG